jgi:hypothetical protein
VRSPGIALVDGKEGHTAPSRAGPLDRRARDCIIAQWCFPSLRQHAGRVESESAADSTGPISDKLKRVSTDAAERRRTNSAYPFEGPDYLTPVKLGGIFPNRSMVPFCGRSRGRGFSLVLRNDAIGPILLAWEQIAGYRDTRTGDAVSRALGGTAQAVPFLHYLSGHRSTPHLIGEERTQLQLLALAHEKLPRMLLISHIGRGAGVMTRRVSASVSDLSALCLGQTKGP